MPRPSPPRGRPSASCAAKQTQRSSTSHAKYVLQSVCSHCGDGFLFAWRCFFFLLAATIDMTMYWNGMSSNVGWRSWKGTEFVILAPLHMIYVCSTKS